VNLGLVATRLAGTDGVSLETQKLATVVERLGHTAYFCAGQLDPCQQRAMLVPEMHFSHPEIDAVSRAAFGTDMEPPGLTAQVHALASKIRLGLQEFVARFRIDVLIPENALAIPMNIPLGVALRDFIRDTGIRTIAHGSDFYWERERFSRSSVPHLVQEVFPPNLPSVRHVVINSLAQRDLMARRGLPSVVVPNVFDFDTPAPGIDEFNGDFRQAIGLADTDLLILQPTRVVPRKGIEMAIELVARLHDPRCKLVVSHAAGDEGLDYQAWLVQLASQRGVDLRFVSDRVAPHRGYDALGRKLYSLWDVYPHADFVTYPSLCEGYGNALVEAIHFRLPMMVNRYPVYVADIAPLGFRFVEIDGMVSDDAVECTRRLLHGGELCSQMTETNLQIARRHLSYRALERPFRMLLDEA